MSDTNLLVWNKPTGNEQFVIAVVVVDETVVVVVVVDDTVVVETVVSN